jgi:hypothetical protein
MKILTILFEFLNRDRAYPGFNPTAFEFTAPGQEVDRQKVDSQNVDRQKVEIQNIERQKVDRQNIDS